MPAYKHFEELPVWQEAAHHYNRVLDLLEEPGVPLSPGFRNQLDRSALSVSNNIAEGFGRYHHKEFAQFVRVALGSLQEVRDQMLDAHAQGYISEAELLAVETTIRRAVSSCAGLERYLRSTTAPPSKGT